MSDSEEVTRTLIQIDTVGFVDEISEADKPSREHVARLAWQYWDEAGQPDGLVPQDSFWLRAESYLEGFHAGMFA